jgi:hypothetical protein
MGYIFKYFCNNTLSLGEGRGEANYGGCGNTVSGNYSAVLGGKGNTVTHNFAAVFGNGLSSVSNDTFHVSCLNAVNTPLGAGAGPTGTMYYQQHVPLGLAWCNCKFLFLQ